jgi:O-antigen/teichoic acid export membrane protein
MPATKILYKSVLWRGLFYFSTFLLNIVIARHFEAAESGSIYYIINIYALAHLLVSLSMESGITYFGSKAAIEPGKLLNLAVLWTLFVTVLLWIAGAVFIDFSYQNISRSLLITSGITFIGGHLLYNYSAGLFYAQKNFMIPNVISLFFNVILLIILPYQAFKLIPGITDDYFYFYSFLAQGICIVVVFKLLNNKRIDFNLPSISAIKNLLQYSLLALTGNIAFFLLYRIDYWFVEKYCTAGEFGNYVQVSKMGQLFFLLPSILATAIFPLTASDNKEKVYSWLALMSRLFLFFYAIVCLVLVITGHWLFPFVFGHSFTSMHVAFIFLVPGILSLSTLYTLTAYNAGINKLKVNLIGCVLALVVVITGNALLVPVYGINAAAAVSSIGYIVFQVYLLLDFKKEYQIKISSFFFLQLDDLKVLKKIRA